MRGDSTRDHFELADALPARFEGAARQRRLEHEDGITLRRLGLDQGARRPAADLFICRPQHHDAAVVEAGAIDDRAGRQHRQRDPGLHVEHARPMQPTAFAFERHAGELADGPHRVEVAEQQDLPRALAEAGAQVIAGAGR
jgi:hypothetical protein